MPVAHPGTIVGPIEGETLTTTTADAGVEDKILHFPDGIPGFPQLERFVIVEFREDGAFQQLQSVDEPDVAMIVCVPWLFFPDYAPMVGDIEQQALELESAEDAILFVPVSIDADTGEISLNLLGPFVVNARTRRGTQLVLSGTEYAVRTPIELPDA